MPGMMQMRSEGTREVLNALSDCQAKVRTGILRRSLYAGAVIIRNEARRNAPVRTGALRRKVIASTDNKAPEDRGQYSAYVTVAKGTYIVSPTGRVLTTATAARRGVAGRKINPRRYAHLAEYGTARSRARPFLRPALDTKRQLAIETIEASVRLEIVSRYAQSLGAK